MSSLLPSVEPTLPVTRRRNWGRWAFLALLLSAGVGLLAWTAVRHFRPAPTQPDVAQDARDYLQKRKVPLSGALAKLLADAEKTPDALVRTQLHLLLGERAPDFELSDPHGQSWKLSEHLAQGPVLVVFYYGYHCNHCVSQLFDINEDMKYFRELGVQVVALSADPPQTTRDRFRRYGEFAFPVLSDTDNKTAQAYRVFSPADGKKEAVLLHGTFVIDRDGMVQWAHVADEPFTGNRTLLHQFARLEGRLPAP
jgi:peroxiredoxin